jgi:hypothetical protein
LVFYKYPYGIPVVWVQGVNVVGGVPTVVPTYGEADIIAALRYTGYLQVVGYSRSGNEGENE